MYKYIKYFTFGIKFASLIVLTADESFEQSRTAFIFSKVKLLYILPLAILLFAGPYVKFRKHKLTALVNS